MELRIFKHSTEQEEKYIVRGDDEHYIYWDYYEHKWILCRLSWKQTHGDSAQEISWLELLVARGISKEEAQKIWKECKY